MSTQYQSALLSRKQLAARWSSSVETIKRRERAGILSPLILGGLVRYDLNQVEEIERQALVKHKQ
jgi:hypothetical protein